MSSGIKATPEVIDACNEVIKKKKAWVVCGFNKELTKVVLLSSGEPGSGFKEFKDNFPKDKALYALFDCKYQLADGGDRNKVLAINYSDDSLCPLKEKMLVSSTVPEMKQKCFKEAAKITEIKEFDEIDEDNFIKIVSENRTK